MPPASASARRSSLWKSNRGVRAGFIVEIRSLTVGFGRYSPELGEINLEGWIVSQHRPDERPDLDPPKQLSDGAKKLKA